MGTSIGLRFSAFDSITVFEEKQSGCTRKLPSLKYSSSYILDALAYKSHMINVALPIGRTLCKYRHRGFGEGTVQFEPRKKHGRRNCQLSEQKRRLSGAVHKLLNCHRSFPPFVRFCQPPPPFFYVRLEMTKGIC